MKREDQPLSEEREYRLVRNSFNLGIEIALIYIFLMLIYIFLMFPR